MIPRPLLAVFMGLLLAIVLAGCGKAEQEPTVVPVALVGVEPAQTATVQETLDVFGTAETVPAAMTTVTAHVESQVAKVLVVVGAEVKRGQELLRLAPTPATLLEVGKARREAEVAAGERDRLRRLREQGLATESELQAAISAAATAAAARDSLDARAGSSDGTSLRAPCDGIVDSVAAQTGDVLAPGAAALKIAGTDKLQVRLGIEPASADRVAAGQSVFLSTLAHGAARVESKVVGVDRRVDPQSRLTAALVTLPPHSGYMPGATLRGGIVVAQHDDVVTVARSALLYAGTQAYVFVVEDQKAQRRNIRAGLVDDERVEVSEGVHADESVVVVGNSVLEDGMAVRLQESEAAESDETGGKSKSDDTP